MRRPPSTVPDREELRRESMLVRANTRASLMSDTKWRKLLSAMDDAELELRRCVVKFVGNPNEQVMTRPGGLYLAHPWVDTFRFGPIPLRSIEWLLFPRVAEIRDVDRTIPSRYVTQHVDAAARIIEGLGKYPVELSDRGLLITGYLPQAVSA
jgi:hypothetical protein